MFNSVSQILGLGLIFGLMLTLILYLILKIQGKETPQIRTGFFIIAFLILFMTIPDESNIYKLFLELLICSILISVFLKTIQEYNFITFLNENRIDLIITGTYIVSLLIGLILLVLKTDLIINLLITILEPFIIFSLGIIIALKLLWSKKQSSQN